MPRAVPGHTPLTPSPLMRRAPRVVLAVDDLGHGSRSGIGAAESPSRNGFGDPSSTLSPNTRMSNMVHHGTHGLGGAGGGPIASIATLKSDLVMVQAEIVAVTRNGSGAVELQSTLTRFAASSDERTNIETCNTLMVLVLMKLNELARWHGAPASTASRQSRVGDILSYFRSSAAASGGGGKAPAAAVERPAASEALSAAGSPPESPAAHRSASAAPTASRPATREAQDAASSAPAPNPDIESRLTPPPQVSEASRDGRDAARRMSSNAGSESPAHQRTPQSVGGGAQQPHYDALVHTPRSNHHHQQQQGSSGLRGLSLLPDPHDIAASPPSLRGKVATLEKQLALFRYLEPTVHAVDHFDHTLRYITMSDALAEVGIDFRGWLGSSKTPIPAHTVNPKTGHIKPTLEKPKPGVSFAKAGTPEASAMSADVAEHAQLGAEAATGGSAEAPEGASAAAPLASAAEVVQVSGLKSLAGFQNAVIQMLVGELKNAKSTPAAANSPQQQLGSSSSPGGAPTSEADVLRERVRRLEAVAAARDEQITAERQLHMLRHERAANVILAERSRSATPGAAAGHGYGGSGDFFPSGASRPVSVLSDAAASRPLSRMLMASYADAPTSHAGGGKLTALVHSHGHHDAPEGASSSTIQAPPPRPSTRQGGVTGIGLPPPGGLGTRATTPLLATRPTDLPGTAENMYRKTIAQQGEIIRDLQRRVATPVAATAKLTAPL